MAGFFGGTAPEYKQLSTLSKSQQGLQRKLESAVNGPGAGGAFGTSADYYRSLFNEDNPTASALFAPEMRRFNEQIIPDLAEQFAGMGAGNLSSSGFRNAAVSAGTDLSERLAAIRANLRQQGAQGLQQIGEFGLRPTVENIQEPGQEGFLSSVAPLAGTAIGAFFGGPGGAAVGNAAGSWLSSGFGKSSPYGGGNNGLNNLQNSILSAR